MISVAPRLQSASAIPKVRTAHYPSRRALVDVRHMHVGIRVNQARAADMH